MALARTVRGVLMSAALVIATTVACTQTSAPGATSSHPPTRAGATISVPTSDWRPPQPAMTALLSGTLTEEPDGCITVRQGAIVAAVIWPHGFSGGRTAAGTLEVLDSNGAPAAYIGQHVSLGGGFDVGRTVHCGAQDRPVFLIEQELPPLVRG